VADFGLTKLLQHTIIQTTSGALTPAYAPPEFLNGQVSRWSDQYSLAVTYCQLRAGQLPFGGNAGQLVAGHLLLSPDLRMLPEPERPTVARALAKQPDQRWPSCRALVNALAAGAREQPSPGPESVWASLPSSPPTQSAPPVRERGGSRLLVVGI